MLHWPLHAVPRIQVAGRFPLDDRDFSHRYRTPTHALHIHEYDGSSRIGRRTFALRPGVLTLTPAGQRSAYDLKQKGHHWCAHFHQSGGPSPRVSLPLRIDLGPRHAFVVERFKELAAMHAQSQRKSRDAGLFAAAASVRLQEMLLWLAMFTRPEASAERVASESALQRAAEILNTRFSEEVTISQLADEVRLTQNYLSARFKKRFGMTMPRYLLSRRIEHARLLLSSTDLPIHRIAERVAMPDAQHFNKQFRKLVGTSPSSFRASSKGRKEG